jgi:hypothetical protein
MFMEDNRSIYLDKDHTHDLPWREQWGNADGYRDAYEHPIWKRNLEEGVKGGHGGMDWLVVGAFLDAVKAGGPMPIDVYDMAAWMSVTCLSEDSIAMGGAVVAMPDFTNGGWITREPMEY